ncbi:MULTISPECIES: class I SAM-dependent methyltransferase [Streptomyces]|uniref:Ubiquinone biosynthesis protein UbiE n=2 Tax=Streptomyces TaxID=1883 RepID=A0A100Y095_9ACTN|nr:MULTISPECIES: class I SAM-dependent methyltransferase [Streptomyces]KUH35327.1 ubiquinone biosynthesis protein UbiE [Streptomyces kanasensis]UUS31430.1 methyltransferase domain-containing protein [Streptomyces changanensis]
MTTTHPEDFLRAFHARWPAVTAETMGRGRTPDGRSSYELLCERATGARSVLDLGCGDGVLLELLARAGVPTLAGVDLSPEALALARRRAGVPAGAALVRGRAQRLPFASGTFDACLSHLALMLMGEVEQVLAEVARVLAPGGTLACVVGGGAVADDDAYGTFLRLLRPVVDALPPERRLPRIGDPRTRDAGALGALLRAAGFGPLVWESVPLRLDGPVADVWASVSGYYDLGPLRPPEVEALRTAFLAEAERITGPDGNVPCAVRLHLARTALLPPETRPPAAPAHAGAAPA